LHWCLQLYLQSGSMQRKGGTRICKVCGHEHLGSTKGDDPARTYSHCCFFSERWFVLIVIIKSIHFFKNKGGVNYGRKHILTKVGTDND
jgi:hypothetical protein